jgi:hypothetical protein
MTSSRYKLVKQLHFIADVAPGRAEVVTIQHWKSKTTRLAVYVRAHNGAEIDRHVAQTAEQCERIELSFQIARRDFADQLLSDDAAGDEVSRRGGPAPKWCHATDCGAQIPFAAAQCPEGHPLTHVNAGTFVMGANRRPAITVITGGRK